MKIWSKTLTLADLRECAKEVNIDYPGCTLEVVGADAGYDWQAQEHDYDDPIFHEGPRTRWYDKVFLRAITGNPNQPCPRCKGTLTYRKTKVDGGYDLLPCDSRECDNGSVNNERLGKNASWAEHGWWMLRVYERDSNARIRGYADYNGLAEFHRITGYRFTDPRSPRELSVIRAMRATATDPRFNRFAA